MDVVGRGVFANNHFAFPFATFLMNRKRDTIPVDFDQESPQFEIIAQCFMQRAARLQVLLVIHCALTSEIARPFDLTPRMGLGRMRDGDGAGHRPVQLRGMPCGTPLGVLRSGRVPALRSHICNTDLRRLFLEERKAHGGSNGAAPLPAQLGRRRNIATSPVQTRASAVTR
jgi:hypothetical protein